MFLCCSLGSYHVPLCSFLRGCQLMKLLHTVRETLAGLSSPGKHAEYQSLGPEIFGSTVGWACDLKLANAAASRQHHHMHKTRQLCHCWGPSQPACIGQGLKYCLGACTKYHLQSSSSVRADLPRRTLWMSADVTGLICCISSSSQVDLVRA